MQIDSKCSSGASTVAEPNPEEFSRNPGQTADSVGESRASRPSKWVRRVHAFLGIVSALNLLLLISTGFLLQHAALLRLDEKTIPRDWIPSSYRPHDGSFGVRADIVVADLHSGRLFGTVGTLTLDVITLAWLIMLTTGLVMYVNKQKAKRRAAKQNGNREEDD